MSSKPSLEERQKIYQSLCYVLSERANQVAWDDFTPADWDLLAQMADREGVAPLMYWKLKDSPVDVPPSTFNLLRSTYYQTLAQNTLLYQELERILEALDAAGIPVIVLKGAALAATVYEDIGLRPMGDLDLLVQTNRVSQTCDLMESLNYVEVASGRTLLTQKLIAHEIKFQDKSRGRNTIEIHQGLIAGSADRRSPPTDWFWNQAKLFYIEYLGRQYFTLSESAHLLYLSAHQAIQHGLVKMRLIWLYDIRLLVESKSSKFDWSGLVVKARDFNWENALGEVLREVQGRFELRLPEDQANSIGAEREKYTSSKVELIANSTQTRIFTAFQRMRYLNRKAQLLFLFSIIFPSPAHMIRHYRPKPNYLWPLYYPYRWIDIMLDTIYSITKLITKTRAQTFAAKEESD